MGRNLFYECGIDYEKSEKLKIITKPTAVKFSSLVKFKKIACGANHSLCLDTNQNLSIFGQNTFGQLGIENENKLKAMIHPFFNESNIMIIKCGTRHSSIITQTSNCYLFGSNLSDQIGIMRCCINVVKPYLFVDYQKKIIFIKNASLGNNHTLLLTTNNQVFSFGDNTDFQCSVVNQAKQIAEPHLISTQEMNIGSLQIQDIIAGNNFSLIIYNPLRKTTKKQAMNQIITKKNQLMKRKFFETI